jgi:tripartite-type tricarboxylate transporter receptor subunit TctC
MAAMSPQTIAAGSAAACLFLTGSALAQSDVAAFYKGKTVHVIAPSGAGGSVYQYALLASNHLGRHIPGSPTSIIQARPGGGGVTAANYVVQAGAKDGTVVAELHPQSLLTPRTGKGANYDPRTFQWLGSLAVRTYVGAVWHTVDARTLEDMKNREYIFGGSGVASASYQYPMFLAYLTGARIKVIPGYKSGGETNLAMERGEVQGRGNYYEGFLATNPDWVRDQKVKFVFKLGPEHPDLAGVPAGSQYAKTPRQQQMLRVLEAPLAVGQAFYVAAGVPKERVEALRAAFRSMLADPQFQAEAGKMKLYINPREPAELSDAVAKVYETPDELFAELKALLTPK